MHESVSPSRCVEAGESLGRVPVGFRGLVTVSAGLKLDIKGAWTTGEVDPRDSDAP